MDPNHPPRCPSAEIPPAPVPNLPSPGMSKNKLEETFSSARIVSFMLRIQPVVSHRQLVLERSCLDPSIYKDRSERVNKNTNEPKTQRTSSGGPRVRPRAWLKKRIREGRIFKSVRA